MSAAIGKTPIKQRRNWLFAKCMTALQRCIYQKSSFPTRQIP